MNKEKADHELSKKGNPVKRKQVPEELLMTDTERRARIRVKMKPVETDAKKRPDLTMRQSVRVRYHNFKQRIKRRVNKMALNAAEKSLRSRIPDNVWWGKILFGILDVVPLPNFHEVWKAIQKEAPDASLPTKMKLMWDKLDGWRTTSAIVVSILGYYQLLG